MENGESGEPYLSATHHRQRTATTYNSLHLAGLYKKAYKVYYDPCGTSMACRKLGFHLLVKKTHTEHKQAPPSLRKSCSSLHS